MLRITSAQLDAAQVARVVERLEAKIALLETRAARARWDDRADDRAAGAAAAVTLQRLWRERQTRRRSELARAAETWRACVRRWRQKQDWAADVVARWWRRHRRRRRRWRARLDCRLSSQWARVVGGLPRDPLVGRVTAVPGAARAIQRCFRRHRADRPAKHARLWRRLQAAAQPELCPITFAPVRIPTLCLADRRVYEAEAISRWADRTHQSPMTRAPIGRYDLVRLDRLAGRLQALDADAYTGSLKRELFDAAGSGADQTVANLLAQGVLDVDGRSDHERTPLHSAARNGHAAVVAELLLHRCLVDPIVDGWTPLQNACYHGPYWDVCRLLLDAGASETARVHVFSDECTAARIAQERHAATPEELRAAGFSV